MAAEYILSQRQPQRHPLRARHPHVRDHTRNTLDLSALPASQRLTHLPVVVDPSHGTGVRRRSRRWPRRRRAGADGIIVEVHPDPAKALSDGPQALTFPMFEDMMRDVVRIVDVMGQTMA